MARKNMFEGIGKGNDESHAAQAPQKNPDVFHKSGPVALMRNDLRNMGSRSVQEVDPSLIEDIGINDRLQPELDDLNDLRASIERYGQQVPIMLRPHPAISGRYQVVYGRRRVGAIKSLGLPVKALIRAMTDEEAILAQGQENNVRKDLSFIEKALFADALESAGYEARVVQDALNVNRSHTAHMRKVVGLISRETLEQIGRAPSVGWKRWHDLALKVEASGLKPTDIHPDAFPEGSSSDQRFDLYAKALDQSLKALAAKSSVKAGVPSPIHSRDGMILGHVSRSGQKIVFAGAKNGSAFTNWIERNAEEAIQELYEKFLAATETSA